MVAKMLVTSVSVFTTELQNQVNLAGHQGNLIFLQTTICLHVSCFVNVTLPC